MEEELDSLLAEDCPFCGQIMIDAVLKPFVDLEDSKEIALKTAYSHAFSGLYGGFTGSL